MWLGNADIQTYCASAASPDLASGSPLVTDSNLSEKRLPVVVSESSMDRSLQIDQAPDAEVERTSARLEHLNLLSTSGIIEPLSAKRLAPTTYIGGELLQGSRSLASSLSSFARYSLQKTS